MSVYNNAGSLPAALDSVLSQKGVELECIAIDDGSTDRSRVILDKAAARDPRLRVVHKSNEGLTRALAEGCALASAPWIARQDADDLSLPGRLRAQLDRALQADSPVLVACGAEYRSTEGLALCRPVPPTGGEVRTRILDQGESPCPHGAAFFSRAVYERIGGYRADFYYAQDLDLFTRLAESGPVAVVEDVLYAYTFSPFSISTHASGIQKEYRDLIREGHALRKATGSDAPLLDQAAALRQAVRTGRRKKSSPFAGFYFMGGCLDQTHPRAAASCFIKAWKCRPWSAKALIRCLLAGVRSL